jgi:hypothetical protein
VEAVGHAPDATKPKHDAGNSAGQAQALAADVLKQLLPRPRPDRKRRLPRRAPTSPPARRSLGPPQARSRPGWRERRGGRIVTGRHTRRELRPAARLR